MDLAQLLESIEGQIKEVTGAQAAYVGEINSSTAELRLHFFNLVDLDTLLRALSSLKKLLKSYGLAVKKPRIEAIRDILIVTVEVVEAKTIDIYHT